MTSPIFKSDKPYVLRNKLASDENGYHVVLTTPKGSFTDGEAVSANAPNKDKYYDKWYILKNDRDGTYTITAAAASTDYYLRPAELKPRAKVSLSSTSRQYYKFTSDIRDEWKITAVNTDLLLRIRGGGPDATVDVNQTHNGYDVWYLDEAQAD